jgi:EmrB/QacA subfamily drug resistance transporter
VSAANPRRVVMTVAFVASSFMYILDTTIVNVALPSIDRDFRVSAAVGSLSVVAYLTMVVAVMPISGWLVDRFGVRRVYLAALAAFAMASALCGLAQSLPELIAARVAQGIGGGAMAPAGMTMMYRAYTPTERLRVARITTLPSAMGPVLGPTIGGLLVQELSWRWVFWVNLPVAVAIFTVCWRRLPEDPGRPATPFDPAGFVLTAVGVGLLVYGISQGAQAGWLTPQILASLGLGLVLCAALVAVELRSPHPLLRLGLLRITGYRQALSICTLVGAAFSGNQYLVPLMLQIRDGYTPIESGLTTFCEAVGVMTSSQVVSRIHRRVGERRLQVLGFVLITSLTTLFALKGASMSPWTVRAVMWGIGYGNGHVQLPNQAMAFDEIDAEDTGHASGLYNTSRRFGSALGVAVLSSAIASSHTAQGVESGFSAAFLAAALLSAAGLLIALGAYRRTGARSLSSSAPKPTPA